MRVLFWSNHGKGQMIYDALAADPDRFQFSVDPLSFDYEVALIDTDSPHAPPVPLKHRTLAEAARRGIRLAMFPHGGPPDLEVDGISPLWLPLWAHLVHGEGHAEIYRQIGYPRRVEVIGFTYCGLAEPTDGPIEHVLFAPIHPWADGKTILPVHGELNRLAYEAFRKLDVPEKTVRLYGEDVPNGIFEREPFISYEQSDLQLPLELIDSVDAVLASGTIAYLALARGKPVVMLGCDTPPMNDEGTKYAAHWDEYKDYLRYPLDVLDGDLATLLESARRDPQIEEWKRLFVGDSFDPDRVCEIVESLRPSREVRRRLARA